MRRHGILGLAAVALLGLGSTSAILGWGGRATFLRVNDETPPRPPPTEAPAAPAAERAPPRGAEPVSVPEVEIVSETDATGGRFGVPPSTLFQAFQPLTARVGACAREREPRAVTGRLMLEIDRMEGRIRILRADSRDDRPGAVEIERCAQTELVGREIDVPGVTPGPVTVLPLRVRP